MTVFAFNAELLLSGMVVTSNVEALGITTAKTSSTLHLDRIKSAVAAQASLDLHVLHGTVKIGR